MNLDLEDYLSLLEVLGKECIGAIQILNDDENNIRADSNFKDSTGNIYSNKESGYKLLSKEEVKRIVEEGVSENSQLIAGSMLSLTGVDMTY